MTVEEVLACFVEVGVPQWVPDRVAGELARGLGIGWIEGYKKNFTWDRLNLAVTFAQRMAA